MPECLRRGEKHCSYEIRKQIRKENKTPDSDEEYEVWCCCYCGKEFDTKKGATFHENVHCKKKNCSYYEDSDQESDGDYEYNGFQTNKISSKFTFNLNFTGTTSLL